MKLEIPLPDERATADLGRRLAALMRKGDFIALAGPLGAGKTSLARAAICELTGRTEAQSPTFSLVETYDAPEFKLWHFDLYRLEKAEEVWELGFEEALDESVAIIEWPDRIEKLIPSGALFIRLSHDGEARRALIGGAGEWAGRLAGLNVGEG